MPIYKRTNDNQGRVELTGGDFYKASGVLKDVLHIVTAVEEASRIIATGFRYNLGINELEVYLNGQVLRCKENKLGTDYGDYTETTNFSVTFETGVIHEDDQLRFRVTANGYDTSSSNNANLNQLAKDLYGRDVTSGLLRGNGLFLGGSVINAITYGNNNDSIYGYRHEGTIENALADIGLVDQRTLYIPRGTWRISPATFNLTIPSNVCLKVDNGTILQIDNACVLEINGRFDAGLYQVFDCVGNGKVIFGAQSIEGTYPQWFGAIGDGITDDSDSLINTCYSVSGIEGLVLIPSGTDLRITKSITTGPISIVGLGQRGSSRIIVDFDGTGLTADTLTKFEIRNMTIAGENLSYTLPTTINKIGLYIAETHNYIVENCLFNNLNIAIDIYGGCYFGVVEKCKFRQNYKSFHASCHAGYPVSGINFLYNDIDGWPASMGGPSTTIGMHIEGNALCGIINAKVIGNGFQNLNQGIYLVYTYKSLFEANWFEDNKVHITDGGDIHVFGNVVLGGEIADPVPALIAITGVSQSNPAVVTASVSGLTNGDRILIKNVNGMYQLNGNTYTVANINVGAGTFELSGINSTAYAAYTSSGHYMIKRIDFTLPSWNLVIAPTCTNTYHGIPMTLGEDGNLRLGYMQYCGLMKETSGLGLAYGNDKIEFQVADPTLHHGSWKIEGSYDTGTGNPQLDVVCRNNTIPFASYSNITIKPRNITFRDFLGTEILYGTTNGITVPKLAADPAILEGSIYYNTTTHKHRGCDNAAWHDLY